MHLDYFRAPALTEADKRRSDRLRAEFEEVFEASGIKDLCLLSTCGFGKIKFLFFGRIDDLGFFAVTPYYDFNEAGLLELPEHLAVFVDAMGAVKPDSGKDRPGVEVAPGRSWSMWWRGNLANPEARRKWDEKVERRRSERGVAWLCYDVWPSLAPDERSQTRPPAPEAAS